MEIDVEFLAKLMSRDKREGRKVLTVSEEKDRTAQTLWVRSFDTFEIVNRTPHPHRTHRGWFCRKSGGLANCC